MFWGSKMQFNFKKLCHIILFGKIDFPVRFLTFFYIYNVSLRKLAVGKGIFICERNEYSSSLSWCDIHNPRPENIQKVKKMAIVPGL